MYKLHTLKQSRAFDFTRSTRFLVNPSWQPIGGRNYDFLEIWSQKLMLQGHITEIINVQYFQTHPRYILTSIQHLYDLIRGVYQGTSCFSCIYKTSYGDIKESRGCMLLNYGIVNLIHDILVVGSYIGWRPWQFPE